MITDLKCECCGTNLSSDFAGNVWCTNDECLLHDRCFSYDFIEGRALARANNEKPQKKERLLQGCPNEPLRDGK